MLTPRESSAENSPQLPIFNSDCGDDNDEVVVMSRRPSLTSAHASTSLTPTPPPGAVLSAGRRRRSSRDHHTLREDESGDPRETPVEGPPQCSSPQPPPSRPPHSMDTVHQSSSHNLSDEVGATSPTSVIKLTSSPTDPTPAPVAPVQHQQPTGGGKMIAGSYKKLKLIGSGADGKVFQAVLGASGVVFAVKEVVITPNTRGAKGAAGPLALTDAEESRIVTMRRQVDKLRMLPLHANIVRHFGTERTTCALNVMMEYVEGGSIESFLKKLGPLSEGTVRHFTRGICHGLAFLHDRSIIHRDIKSANCLVNKEGTVKIADFGSCEMPEGGGDQAPRVKNQPLKGTSMWMAPEAIMQEEAVTPLADMWSLGCTVVEMASGRAPWYEARFTNEWAAMFHISQCGHGPPLPSLLSRQAHDFLGKCFEIDPAKRLTAAQCLEHPFLAQDFDPNSADESMQPPHPSELANRPKLPMLRRSPSLDGTTISDDETLSNPSYSSIQSFAVYDHEMGDAEDYVDALVDEGGGDSASRGITDDTGSSAGTASTTITRDRRVSDSSVKDDLMSTNAPSHSGPAALSDIIEVIVAEGKETASALLLLTLKGAAGSSTNQHAPSSSSIKNTNASSAVMVVAATPGTPLEKDPSAVHDGFITPSGRSTPVEMLQQAARDATLSGGDGTASDGLEATSHLFEDIDEHGFGLPEPVLFNVLHFLGARDLCQLSMVKRSLHAFVNTGAREVLWRHLFIAFFGDVDPVRDTLRTNWKEYYKNSAVAKRSYPVGFCAVEERRFFVQRQLCHSNTVFDGWMEDGPRASASNIGNSHGARVVIKVEKWAANKFDRRIVGTSGGFARVGTPLESTPTRHRGRAPLTRQVSGLCKTPQVASSIPTLPTTIINNGNGGQNSPELVRSPPSSSLTIVTSPLPSSAAPRQNHQPLTSPPIDGNSPGGSRNTSSGAGGPQVSKLPPSVARRRNQPNSMSTGVGMGFVSNGVAGGSNSLASPNKGLPPRTPRHVSPGAGLNPSSPYRLPRLGNYVPPQMQQGPTNATVRPSLGALKLPSSAGNATLPSNLFGLSVKQIRRRSSGPQQPRAYQFVQPFQQVSPAPVSVATSTSQSSNNATEIPLPPRPVPLGGLRRGNTPSSPGNPQGGLDLGSAPSSPGHAPSGPLTPTKSASFHPPPATPSPSLFASSSSGAFPPPPGSSYGYRSGSGQHPELSPSRAGMLNSPPPRTADRSLRPRELEGSALFDMCRVYDVPISTTATRPDRSLVQHQYKLLKHLEYFNAKCIPRVYGYVESDQYRSNFLVTGALGPSIHEMLHLCGNQFSLQTVLRLGIRLVSCVEEIHERDVVHGNVTPRNLVVGPPDSVAAANSVFLVNFSLGHFFRNPKTHRPNTTGTTSITAERAQQQNEFMWFCSKFVQDRCTPAPRDDLISVLYVVCYFLHGSLPWMSSDGKRLSRSEMLRLKGRFPEVLQQASEAVPSTTPRHLYLYLKTCHGLRQNEIPDYPFLKSLFSQAMQERQIKDDGSFDWSKMYPKES